MALRASYTVSVRIDYSTAAARDAAYTFLKTQLVNSKGTNPYLTSILKKEDKVDEDV